MVLAAGFSRVSIRSVKGRRGGLAYLQLRGRRDIGRRIQRLAVEMQRDQVEFVAVEFQRRVGAPLRMRPQRQRRDDARRVSIERNIEIDRIDQEVGDAIIGEANGLSNMRAHRDLSIVAGFSGSSLPASCGEGPGADSIRDSTAPP